MREEFLSFQHTKVERSLIKDFKIDTSHCKYYGPRVVRVFDIDIDFD